MQFLINNKFTMDVPVEEAPTVVEMEKITKIKSLTDKIRTMLDAIESIDKVSEEPYLQGLQFLIDIYDKDKETWQSIIAAIDVIVRATHDQYICDMNKMLNTVMEFDLEDKDIAADDVEDDSVELEDSTDDVEEEEEAVEFDEEDIEK